MTTRKDRNDAPAYGEHHARRFGLERQQSHVTRNLRRSVLAVTQIKSDKPTPGPTTNIGYDEAWLVGLQLRDVPDHELWQDGRPLPVEAFATGDTTFYDLRRDPVAVVRQPYHCLQFYLPRAAMVEVAQQNGIGFHGELNWRYGTRTLDPVVRHLGEALVPALERGGAVDGLFLDHILHALALHVVATYGDSGPQAARKAGGLASWQEHRAKEMMRSTLDGSLSLSQLAEACGLSVSHFARAFRQTAGTSPRRWLREQRIEQAMRLLARTGKTLSQIAVECGFADQSHFTRAFGLQTGISPGQWRRQNAPRD